ncbi:peptidase M23 [Paraburkholderia sediminicola]|uniref:peptidase M23 n=1 Tax=Paraburkholderia sediminicola TaxID=458836 RepID=UPI0038B95D54
MIISPPFLPEAALASNDPDAIDPMMDAVDRFELAHGIYPIAFDRRWHPGMHLAPRLQNEKVRAIADGEVVAYRVCQHAFDSGGGVPDSNAGFVLLKHTTDTGEGRKLTFYSLYMHLLELDGYNDHGFHTDVLPSFLRTASPGPNMHPPAVASAQAGGGRKIYRKDILGLAGRCHGQLHLHFEIFMTKPDFDAYFGATQLGHEQVVTPTATDYWGSSYYVIPPQQQFLPLPPGTDANKKLHGIPFEQLDAGQNTDTLYVEVWFHKGEKFTKVWRDAGGSRLELLTEQPLREPNYEYDLYKRATALYATCPSDGYELLRFGRILGTPTTLPEAARTNWAQVAFATGRKGYIDVSNRAVLKLSDADFPFFKGWKKISEGSGPFDADGLCDIDALKQVLKDAKDHETPQEAALTEEYQKEDALVRYVKATDGVREQLRGFVCEAPSEWDSTHNEDRYRKLKDTGEFYDGNAAGYTKFLNLLKSFQFWDHTGLPAGEKLWFFHPAAFIRHFRKCGWLSIAEFERIYADRNYSNTQIPRPAELRSKYLIPLNFALRKYGLTTPIRQAHFLGQGAVESAWLTLMQETSMLGYLDASGFHGTVRNPVSLLLEASIGHWYGQLPTEDDAWFRSTKFNSGGVRIAGSYDWKNGNCDRDDAQKFRGRGFKQLTGRSNYADYWVFRGWISTVTFSTSWWTDPAFISHNRAAMTKRPAQIGDPQRVALPENCVDSGGFYLRFNRPRVASEIDRDPPRVAVTPAERQAERLISRAVTYAINGGYLDDAGRLLFTRAAKEILV